MSLSGELPWLEVLANGLVAAVLVLGALGLERRSIRRHRLIELYVELDALRHRLITEVSWSLALSPDDPDEFTVDDSAEFRDDIQAATNLAAAGVIACAGWVGVTNSEVRSSWSKWRRQVIVAGRSRSKLLPALQSDLQSPAGAADVDVDPAGRLLMADTKERLQSILADMINNDEPASIIEQINVALEEGDPERLQEQVAALPGIHEVRRRQVLEWIHEYRQRMRSARLCT